MSVLFGVSFDDVVMLDIDERPLESARDRSIEAFASRISIRWELGDCLIILSSAGDTLSYHLVFDRILSWVIVHQILVRLARENKIDRNLARLELSRGDFTFRLSADRANHRFLPFPIGIVRYKKREMATYGGIKKWVSAWKLAKNISHISEIPISSSRIARIPQKA